jgi:catechol 2,3-dioxygenase-like lactoylglutathione lyase family enzyme
MSSTAVGGLKSMTMTTRIQNVALPVADQDRALAFYTEVLGCELRYDVEVWPGARFVEVVPPGSSVGLVLLPPDSEIPMAVRLRTTNAESAYARLREAGATLHNDEVLLLEGSPPMFFFADPDGNGLVYLEEEEESPPDSSRS